jgi:hypothetical protein
MLSEPTRRAIETACTASLLLAFLIVVLASLGCEAPAKANQSPDAGKKVEPTVIILTAPPPPAVETTATVSPPVVIESYLVGELPKGMRVSTLTNREVSALTLYDAADMPRWTWLDGPGAVLTKVEDNLWTHAPKQHLKDTLAPPKAAVKLGPSTYRACTCGDNCTCANCPDDCNTVARNDCPGGVCPVPMGRPQRSVLTRSTANHAGTASGDCASGACGGRMAGVRRAVLAPVRFVRERQPVRRVFGRVFGRGR